MEIFLAQLLGLYLVIFGAISLFRQKSLMPAVKDMMNNRAFALILGVVELAAGLAIIIAYPMVGFDLTGIISLFGWVMAIEAVLYLALPYTTIQKHIRRFNKTVWYRSGGVLSIALGAYLALMGFGII